MTTRSSLFQRALAVFVTCAGAAWLSLAHADALPAATGFVQCSTPGAIISDPAACSGTNDSATLSVSPFAMLSANASAGPFDPAVGSAFAVLNYSFQVVGGSAGDVVPLAINTSLLASSYGGGYFFSEIIVSTNLLGASAVICSSGCGNTSVSFSGTLYATARSGDVNTVHLEIEAGGGYSPIANGASASADPRISIDSSFAGASQYSILQSAGVGNGSAMPVSEPASALLTAGGLAALMALTAKRRQRVAQASGSA